jgi:signal transduction histidine kinase
MEVSRTIRKIMTTLRPPMLDDFGLPPALRWYADLYSERTGIAVSVQVDQGFPRLSEERETALFRIVQEALTNAAKHADARQVTVRLARDGCMVRLSIGDDGRGFNYPAAQVHRNGSGWGLTTMRERVELIGGSFHLDSVPGVGTTVSVETWECS